MTVERYCLLRTVITISDVFSFLEKVRYNPFIKKTSQPSQCLGNSRYLFSTVGINGSTDIAKSRILQERGKTIQARY